MIAMRRNSVRHSTFQRFGWQRWLAVLTLAP